MKKLLFFFALTMSVVACKPASTSTNVDSVDTVSVDTVNTDSIDSIA